MAIDFPAGNAGNSPFEAPNGVTYTWNADGYWEAETDPSAGYVLPIASDSVLGGVKVGARLSIAGDGTLSADAQGGDGGATVGSLQEVTDVGNTTDNVIQVGGNANSGTETGSRVYPGGIQCTQATPGSGVRALWDGYEEGNSTPTSQIYTTGAASFAGGELTINQSGNINKAYTISCYNNGTYNDSDTGLFNGYNTAGVETSSIKADGSAEFASGVGFGTGKLTPGNGYPVLVTGNFSGDDNWGEIRIASDNVTQPSISVNQWNGTDAYVNTVGINSNGSATFAGQVDVGNPDDGAGTRIFSSYGVEFRAPGLDDNTDGSSLNRVQLFRKREDGAIGGQFSVGGVVELGGTLTGFPGANSEDPNIQLDGRDGSAEFLSGFASFQESGNLRIQNQTGADDANAAIFLRNEANDTTTAKINFDGSAEFAGGNITLNANGRIDQTRAGGDAAALNQWFNGNNGQLIGTLNVGAFYLGTDINSSTPSTTSNITLLSGGVLKVSEPVNNVTAGLCRTNSGTTYGLTIAPADDENNFTAFIKDDGSATFAGRVKTKSDFNLYVESDVPSNAELLSINVPSANAGNDFKFIHCNVPGSGTRFSVNKDGSATFSGAINGNFTGNYLPVGDLSNSLVLRGDQIVFANQDGSDCYGHFASDGSAEFDGPVISGPGDPNPGANVASKLYPGSVVACNELNREIWVGFDKDNSTATSKIRCDGSAEFDGSVDVSSKALTEDGVRLRDFGCVQIRRDGTPSPNRILELYKDGNAASNITASITNDGSAEFKGIVGAEGTDTSARLHPTGLLFVRSNSVGLEVRNTSDPDAVQAQINADGSAYFGAEVHVGHLADRQPASGGSIHSPNGFIEVQRPNINSANEVFLSGYGGTITTSIYANGNATFAGTINGTTVGTSDEKFKQNITTASSQLSDVVALGGMLKNFDWNADAPVNESIRATRQLGLVAQQVEVVCPSLVKTIGSEDDSHKGISHDALIMKLLGAVKELDALRPTHVSFDASAGNDFDFSTAKIASHNVESVERTAKGKFTITFTNAFASDKYTAVATAGDEDHGGTGASPRCVNVVGRTATSLDIVVERSDDAVQDDDGYISVFIAQ